MTGQRGSGRTTRMIHAIPETGAIVVGNSEEHARALRDTVVGMRGRDLAEKCVFTSPRRAFLHIRTRALPVLVDHSVSDE